MNDTDSVKSVPSVRSRMNIRPILDFNRVVRGLDEPPELALHVVLRDYFTYNSIGLRSLRVGIRALRVVWRMRIEPHLLEISSALLKAREAVVFAFIESVVRVEQASMTEPLTLRYGRDWGADTVRVESCARAALGSVHMNPAVVAMHVTSVATIT